MRVASLITAVGMLMQMAGAHCQTTTATTPVLSEPRSWQRETGGAFTASLRGLEGGKVILQSADGRTAAMDLPALSRNDRDYVRGKMAVLAQRWLEQEAAPKNPAPDRAGWPEVVSVPQESLRMSVKRPFKAGQGMKFASAHFEFDAPVEISSAEQRSIATPFELIHEVWRLAPWGVITRPKDGGLFQVELFLHSAAYEASGALRDSGCHYDEKTKKLRVLGSAVGLDPARAPLWRDEQPPVPALAYGMVPLFMRSPMAMVPDWIIASLALALRDLPMQGCRAWPGELLSTLAESTADTHLTESEIRLFLSPSDSKANPPTDLGKLRRMASYLMRGDGSQGANLGAFLAAAAADQPLWDALYQGIRERAEARKKSSADPTVETPAMPPVPHNIEDLNLVQWFHLPKLLGTPDTESGLKKAVAILSQTP